MGKQTVLKLSTNGCLFFFITFKLLNKYLHTCEFCPYLATILMQSYNYHKHFYVDSEFQKRNTKSDANGNIKKLAEVNIFFFLIFEIFKFRIEFY